MSTKKLQIIDSLIKQAENANTLGGKSAEEFARASDVEALQSQVGDATVAEQIDAAVNETNELVEDLDNRVETLEANLNLKTSLPNTISGTSIFVNDVSPVEHNLDITLTDSDDDTFIAVSSEEIQSITNRDKIDSYGYDDKWTQLNYSDKVQYISINGYSSDRPAFGGNNPNDYLGDEDSFMALAIADEICDIKYYKVETDSEGNPYKTDQVIEKPSGNWLDYYVDDQYPMYEGDVGLFCADITYPNFISVNGNIDIHASYHGNEDGMVWGTVSYTGWDIDHRNFPITLSLKGTCESLNFPEGSELVIAYYSINQNFTVTIGDNNKITIPETKIYTSSTNVKSIAPNMCITTNNPNTTITCTYNQDMSKVFVKQESIAPLIVTTGEDGLATHSPTEMLEHVRNGGSVYYNNLSLTYLDENHAQFDFIGDDGVCGTNFIYADKSEEYFEYPIGSQPPLIVKTENGLSTHTPAEIFDYVKSGGSVFYWADAAADEVNDLQALSEVTTSYASFSEVSDDGFVSSIYIYDDKSYEVFEYEIEKTPLIVTQRDDGLATHTPAEMLEHVQKGGQVFLDGYTLSFIDESWAKFDYVGDDNIIGTMIVYADKHIEAFDYDIRSTTEILENDYNITYNKNDERVIFNTGLESWNDLYLDDTSIRGVYVDEDDPTCAVNKEYVDTAMAKLDGIYSVKNENGAIEHIQLDNNTILDGTLDMYGNRIHNVDVPVDDGDAANKAYVDKALAELELITVDDIDEICGATIQVASLDNGVTF